MTIRVDAAAGVVADQDGSWPLRLDCRTGTATLSCPDGEITVAPLRWRDKQRLARWAHLGPDFVARHSVDLAVAPGTELDGRTRALVAAVATFLNGDALPLSPELLSSVATQVCRLTGLAPAAFDDRDAVDVEAIWRGAAPQQQDDTVIGDRDVAPVTSTHPSGAAGADATAATDPWADATRIVITPDRPEPPVAPPGCPPPPRPGPPEHPATAERATPEWPPTRDTGPGPDPGAAEHDAPPPRSATPAITRRRDERKRRPTPLLYRVAPVPVPVTPPPGGAVRTADADPAPLPPTPVPVQPVVGPLVAPASPPPPAPPSADGDGGAPPGAAVAPGRLLDTDVLDTDLLDTLAAAVAGRLAEQLTRGGQDLGIGV